MDSYFTVNRRFYSNDYYNDYRVYDSIYRILVELKYELGQMIMQIQQLICLFL